MRYDLFSCVSNGHGVNTEYNFSKMYLKYIFNTNKKTRNKYSMIRSPAIKIYFISMNFYNFFNLYFFTFVNISDYDLRACNCNAICRCHIDISKMQPRVLIVKCQRVPYEISVSAYSVLCNMVLSEFLLICMVFMYQENIVAPKIFVCFSCIKRISWHPK